MTKPLVDILKEIKGISPEIVLDRTRTVHETLRRVSQTNSILRRAIQGETTIPEELENVLRRLGGLRNLYPHYNNFSEQELSYFEELMQLIGYPDTSNFDTVAMNPVSLGVGGAGIGAAAAYRDLIGPFRSDHTIPIDRRDLLKRLGVGAIAISGLFALVGGGIAYTRIYPSSARENANYLQFEIKSYVKSNVTKS